MRLIREKKFAAGFLLLAPLLLTGCGFTQHRENSPPAAQVDPIPPDEAMQKRDWAQATATYPDGAVAAGPTEFNYEPKRGRPEVHYYYDDTATFFVNMVLLPYNLYKHPQTEVKITPGETCPPSFTANPVMPPQAIVQPNTTPVIEPGAEPSTPKVVEPGAESTTPKVVEPGAMPPPEHATSATPSATPETPAAPAAPSPAPETPATPAAPETPPAQTAPPAAPQTEAAPAPTAAQPEPSAPAAAPAPAPTPGEVAPSTPRIIEPPPPQATKNLAPPMQHAPSTQPYLNK